ncbi:MAG: hypothetical protein GQ474_07355 [Sulfurimonas sp.]|nr:hypothetical protein [Sulfurimonas sp.]
MKDYKKLNSFITILTNKSDYLNSYSREVYRSNRYDYPISSLNIFIPENIATKKIENFIIDSFRGSDIVYCNYTSQYIQVLLPFTPEEHLDIIIDRMNKKYDAIKQAGVKRDLICETVKPIKNTDDIEEALTVLEKADENANVEIKFNKILKKLLSIAKEDRKELNFINYYCGIKVNYKATLVQAKNGLYTFETDPLQLAAINESSKTTIQIKKYGYDISAKINNIDFKTNRVTLEDLYVKHHNEIYPTSLTVKLKEPLEAQLVSLGSNADIEVSEVSFNEIHGYGDISKLVIDNNTLRLSIKKYNNKHTLLVKFIHSRFDGETQRFTLRVIDDSKSSMELFQSLVAKRSRECIKELKRLIA